MTEPLIITSTDLHEMKYCSRGARRWFAHYELDWSDFVQNGIDAEVMLATGDAMAIKLVEFVKEKNRGV